MMDVGPKIWQSAKKPAGIHVQGGDTLGVLGAGGYRDPSRTFLSPLTMTRWRPDRRGWFLALFALGWDGCLLVLLSTGGWSAWITLHVIAGIVVTYLAVTAFLCRLTVVVTPQSLSVRQTLFSPRAKVTRDLATQNVTGLYVEETKRLEGSVNDTEIWRPIYHVTAVLTTGAHERVLSDLEDEPHARFLKAAIEEYLATTG
ncbi:hypothetical protein LZC95_28455 [Pendulispora brunnea]|uniref:GPI-GlcNAc transferase complex PIG-H component conserved domain-containing protein n=1 Tax=Pendulispora brunnea TaxID=2905690 RepID=A0ABZ2JZ76_9BACT